MIGDSGRPRNQTIIFYNSHIHGTQPTNISVQVGVYVRSMAGLGFTSLFRNYRHVQNRTTQARTHVKWVHSVSCAERTFPAVLMPRDRQTKTTIQAINRHRTSCQRTEPGSSIPSEICSTLRLKAAYSMRLLHVLLATHRAQQDSNKPIAAAIILCLSPTKTMSPEMRFREKPKSLVVDFLLFLVLHGRDRVDLGPGYI